MEPFTKPSRDPGFAQKTLFKAVGFVSDGHGWSSSTTGQASCPQWTADTLKLKSWLAPLLVPVVGSFVGSSFEIDLVGETPAKPSGCVETTELSTQGPRYGTSFAFHADLAMRGALVPQLQQGNMWHMGSRMERHGETWRPCQALHESFMSV